MVAARFTMLSRELWRLRAQAIAAALVVACGIAVLVAMNGAWRSLASAKDRYYEMQRFADVFANVKRAPVSLEGPIRAIPGVREVLMRIVHDVNADVPSTREPATLRLISLPAVGKAGINALWVSRGRLPDPSHDDEAVLSVAFANANALDVGGHVTAILNGHARRLTITGLGMSPEYVYEVGQGMVFPDNRRFGVMWMGQAAMESAFDMEGGFNDLAILLDAEARPQEVVTRLDRMLLRYGCLGAYERTLQQSNRFLSDELDEIRVIANYVPALFLAVAAFLLYTLLSRLVTLQRAEVGLLKAFGYSTGTVAIQYVYFGLATVLLGVLLGVPGGLYLEELLVGLYRQYFHFPVLNAELSPGIVVGAVMASVCAASVGSASAALRAGRLSPVEAMRPELPLGFRASFLDRAGLLAVLPIPLRLILRNLARRPAKALMSITAIALAVGLTIVGRFGLDGVNTILNLQFGRVQHEDVTLIFNEPRSLRVAHDLAQMPGVLRVEPFRIVPVWLRNANRSKRTEITGLETTGELHEVVGYTSGRHPIASDGLVLSARLAAELGLSVGERVEVEVLEGRRNSLVMRVADVVDDLLGAAAYMDHKASSRLLGEAPAISGAYLRVDADKAQSLYQRLKSLPVVSSVIIRSAVIASIERTLDRTFVVSSLVLAAFATVIVAGVVYNNFRIALSERGNELASLRVLGFSQQEVSGILLGEQFFLTVLSLPVGIAVGYGLCALLVPMFDREAFRIPLSLSRQTLAQALLPAIGAAAVAGLLVQQRLRRLDLIAVLKSRE
ncbi:FtsX-like permease family protein [Cupriavidus sp. WKF15]|uniref:ABC transporter permease n=1 Tax=Cupriavidus sp. WKF15 TaxID=3032282 RepID=UPI0023E28970|nr:FtsX-like permease family protein [Cupriavidus sp. WKF15]WER50638.1 FtsX-like permease family protein [Cupriavidus sp. WKF15]